jgi:hypothetical protein
MMDESKTPPTHMGSCRYLTWVPRGFGFVHHPIAILYHQVPNANLTIRNFFIAVGGGGSRGALLYAQQHGSHEDAPIFAAALPGAPLAGGCQQVRHSACPLMCWERGVRALERGTTLTRS